MRFYLKQIFQYELLIDPNSIIHEKVEFYLNLKNLKVVHNNKYQI